MKQPFMKDSPSMKGSTVMKDYTREVEAILFASGRSLSVQEIARLCNLRVLEPIKKALFSLQQDYEERGSALMVVEEAKETKEKTRENEQSSWKVTIREQFTPLVQNIVPQTELNRPVMETLAVIAWKQPVLQSAIIKVRSSSAYDHIKELEELGFLTRQRKGRSMLLKVTPKFLAYFDLKGTQDARDLFKDINPSNVQKKMEEFSKGQESKDHEPQPEPPEPSPTDVPPDDTKPVEPPAKDP